MKEDKQCCGFTLFYIKGYGLLHLIVTIYLMAVILENNFELVWHKWIALTYLVFVCIPGLVLFICLTTSNYSLTWRSSIKQLTWFQVFFSFVVAIYALFHCLDTSFCLFNENPFAFEKLMAP